MRSDNSVEVVGTPLYSKGLDSSVDRVIQVILNNKTRRNWCISATGAHGMVFSKKNQSFKELLNNFYMNLPDGMPGVWVGKIKGAKLMTRCYGPDFFARVMNLSSNKEIKHYLCGGAEGVADKLKKTCEEKFNNTNIVGTFCPPFKNVDEYDYKGIAESINHSGTDIVWVGISTPKQEVFAMRLSKYTNVHFIATVGAAFDFHIGNIKQAPSWIQKIGMEWFFRLFTEPRRLYKRYLEIVPKFMFYGLMDIFQFHSRNIFSQNKRIK